MAEKPKENGKIEEVPPHIMEAMNTLIKQQMQMQKLMVQMIAKNQEQEKRLEQMDKELRSKQEQLEHELRRRNEVQNEHVQIEQVPQSEQGRLEVYENTRTQIQSELCENMTMRTNQQFVEEQKNEVTEVQVAEQLEFEPGRHAWFTPPVVILNSTDDRKEEKKDKIDLKRKNEGDLDEFPIKIWKSEDDFRCDAENASETELVNIMEIRKKEQELSQFVDQIMDGKGLLPEAKDCNIEHTIDTTSTTCTATSELECNHVEESYGQREAQLILVERLGKGIAKLEPEFECSVDGEQELQTAQDENGKKEQNMPDYVVKIKQEPIDDLGDVLEPVDIKQESMDALDYVDVEGDPELELGGEEYEQGQLTEKHMMEDQEIKQEPIDHESDTSSAESESELQNDQDRINEQREILQQKLHEANLKRQKAFQEHVQEVKDRCKQELVQDEKERCKQELVQGEKAREEMETQERSWEEKAQEFVREVNEHVCLRKEKERRAQQQAREEKKRLRRELECAFEEKAQDLVQEVKAQVGSREENERLEQQLAREEKEQQRHEQERACDEKAQDLVREVKAQVCAQEEERLEQQLAWEDKERLRHEQDCAQKESREQEGREAEEQGRQEVSNRMVTRQRGKLAESAIKTPSWQEENTGYDDDIDADDDRDDDDHDDVEFIPSPSISDNESDDDPEFIPLESDDLEILPHQKRTYKWHHQQSEDQSYPYDENVVEKTNYRRVYNICKQQHEQLNPNEDEIEKKRRLNRAAAQRCRRRQSKWVKETEKRVDFFNSANKQLQNEATLLRNDIAVLKQLLLAHKKCPVTLEKQRKRKSKISSTAESQPGSSAVMFIDLEAESQPGSSAVMFIDLEAVNISADEVEPKIIHISGINTSS